MYCPQCATQNVDDVKFCRACGTPLESVALVLSGKSPKPSKADKNKSEPKSEQDWLEKRIEGASGMTRGAILLTVSAIIGLAMALFMPASFDAPWILIWTVFFGWMAVWGGIEMAYGFSGILEARSRLRLLELTGNKSPVDAYSPQLSSSAESDYPRVHDRAARLSVTEGTTRQLDEHLNDEEGKARSE